MCKIVQEGDWSGLVDNKQVPMLSLRNKDAKNIDIKTVTQNSQKLKYVLLEDRNVYKIKKVHTGRQCQTWIKIRFNLL